MLDSKISTSFSSISGFKENKSMYLVSLGPPLKSIKGVGLSTFGICATLANSLSPASLTGFKIFLPKLANLLLPCGNFILDKAPKPTGLSPKFLNGKRRYYDKKNVDLL